MLCSVCKKNVAVIFVNKIVDGKMNSTGLCIPCAKKQGLAPMDQIMQQSGFMPEDFDNINNQLSEVMEDIDLEQLTEGIGGLENGDIEGFSKKDLGNLMNFMNTAFFGIL